MRADERNALSVRLAQQRPCGKKLRAPLGTRIECIVCVDVIELCGTSSSKPRDNEVYHKRCDHDTERDGLRD